MRLSLGATRHHGARGAWPFESGLDGNLFGSGRRTRGPVGEFGWKGVAQGNAGTRDTRLEAVEARRTKPTLTSLVRFNATFAQKGLSRKMGPD